MLLYSDISNTITFWSVNILKCKNVLIGFLDELGNFKQFFYISENQFNLLNKVDWISMVL